MRRMKIVIPILKNCLVIFERFKSRILCFELNAVGKYNVLEKVLEAVRDESYFHLVAILFEKKKRKETKERCKDKNRKLFIYSCRYAYKLEESKRMCLQSTDTAFTHRKHDKYSYKQKAKSRWIKRYSKGTCNSKLTCDEFVALVIV